MTGVVRALIIALAAYAAVCVLLLLARERMVFPLRSGQAGEPSAFGLEGGRRVLIPTGDGDILSGWFLPALPAPATAAPAIIWFPGNAETLAGIAPILRQFRIPGVALLAADYRGYGGSTGSVTVGRAQRDALALWDWLARQSEVDPTRIVVYGRSIGTGSALYLAAERPAAGLIVESAFTTLRGMARRHYPWLPSRLAPAGFDNLGNITRSRCPVLVIHGDRDAIIPADMGRALHAAAGERGELYLIRGADHNETYDVGDDEYASRFRGFVTGLTSGARVERPVNGS